MARRWWAGRCRGGAATACPYSSRLLARRPALQVQGQRSSDRYTVFPAHFCSCQSFHYDVVSRTEAIYVSSGGRVGAML